jgi:arylformamidase
VVLVGIDTPSVDPFSSDDLPAHRALLERGMTWIEGLWLGGVVAGRYQLVALPMAIVGADAAPARVALRGDAI